MTTAESAMALGMPADLAIRVAYEELDITTTAASTQGSGQLRRAGNKLVRATAHLANGSLTLPADSEIGDEILINNVTGSALTLTIYPATGHTINAGAATTGNTTLAQALGRIFKKTSATRWVSWLAA